MTNLIKKFVSTFLTSAALTLTVATPVNASVHGCTVLLCLASTTINPMSIPECVGPLTQFWSDLWHGHGFPSCPEAGPGNGFNNLVYEEFLPCPPGSVDLLPGTHIDAVGTQMISYGSAYNIGSPYRSCGTTYMGMVDISLTSHNPHYVPQYNSIQTMPAKPYPWYFNVMVNGAVNNVIR